MINLTLSEEAYEVLKRLLDRLTQKSTWIHSQWIGDASLHEATVIRKLSAQMKRTP